MTARGDRSHPERPVLLLAAVPDDVDHLVTELREGGLVVAWSRVETRRELFRGLQRHVDAVVVDPALPGIDILDVLKSRSQRIREVPFVIVADPDSEDTAMDCLRLGASDYVLKDRLARLPQAVQVAVTTYRLRLQRERDRRELERSEERYRKLFTEDLSGLFVSTPAGRLLDCNPAFAALIGVESVEEALRVDVNRLYRDSSVRRDILRRLGAGEAYHLEEHELVNVRGETVRVVESAVGTVDAAGRLVQVAGYVVDVTDRHEAEKRHGLLATAVEAAGEAVIITDPDGVIQYVNGAFEKITGYGRDEAVGRKPSMLKSGNQGDGIYADLWRTITAGDVWTGDLANRRKDGALYEQETSISPVRDPATGRIVNYVAIARDVTRERSLQAQLHATRRFESLGRMAGAVAHDFNNLLTVVRASAALAKMDVGDGSPAEDELSLILESAERGAALTRQLLAFARRQELDPEALDLGLVVKDAEPLVRRLVGEGVSLRVQAGPGPLMATADRGQIEQVLFNLAANARDAMADGGALRIEVNREVVQRAFFTNGQPEEVSPGAYIALTVADTGHGMDAATRSRVFEPFFTTKADGRGTGLGLSTVYGIVRQSDGHVRLRSEPGRGTEVQILLPESGGAAERRPTADVGIEAPQREAIDSRGMRGAP